MNPISIYIHIPYCASKCVYCDFNSSSMASSKLEVPIYIKTLMKEIGLYESELKNSQIETLYFGGGTPSLIDSIYIEEILQILRNKSRFSETIEITIEGNPESLTYEKLCHYKKIGINRLSIGLQSTDDGMLKTLGRVHTYDVFLKAYENARNAGFDNINVDLMFGLPNQTQRAFEDTIDKVVALKPEHISSYSLKVEEGTPLYVLEGQGLFKAMDEDLERDLYRLLIQRLEGHGIYQYELSNFSKKGFESRHNLTYWKNRPYIGFGASAHSKYKDFRFANFSDLDIYKEYIENHDKPICENHLIDEEEDLFESIMLGLRLNEGLSISDLEKKYKINFRDKYHKAISEVVKKGLLDLNGDCLKLTYLGMDLSNQVFVAFL